MIKFFRNIRQRYITEGKTTKYFKYAIGEIFLVVIGILIALQINNWNNNNSNKKIINKNSRILIENLEKDSLHIIDLLKVQTKQKNLLLDFEERISSTTSTIDTLIKIARFEFSPYVGTIKFPNDNAYNTMVVSGEINLFNR